MSKRELRPVSPSMEWPGWAVYAAIEDGCLVGWVAMEAPAAGREVRIESLWRRGIDFRSAVGELGIASDLPIPFTPPGLIYLARKANP